MVERDIYQLNLMLRYLQKPPTKILSLGDTINSLEMLCRGLQNVHDNKWFEEFGNYWWNLEIIYAVILDEGHDTILTEEKNMIKENIMELKRLVEEKILKYENSLE